MHPSTRLLSLELSSRTASRPLYVCSSCRHEPLPRPFVAHHQIRPNSTSVTENLRRKLWGTENPPGLKDPYGGKSALEKKWGRKGQSAAETDADTDEIEEGDIAPPDAYVPATTADELPRIGHLGKWSDYPPTEADVYRRFMTEKRAHGPSVDEAAHMAAIEICLLRKLAKPVSSACHVQEHNEEIQRLLLECRVDSSAATADWGSAVVFPNEEARNVLVYVFEQIGNLENEQNAEQPQQQEQPGSKEETNAHLFGRDNTKELSFTSPSIRFAFMKRFSQLTGHYLPDPLIHGSSTIETALQHVHNIIRRRPKLGAQLSKEQSLQSLPNVKILNRRHRSSDIDKAVGRKKVIDAVLRERGLLGQ